jgi:predicted phosphoribosyltransferase
MFADRSNAGVKLVEKLREIEITNPVVLAVPNGGIETSLPIVESLNSSFDLIILEKMRIPTRPDLSFGAITEDGSTSFNDYEKFVNHDEKMELISKAKQKIRKKISDQRASERKLDIKGRNVIIVDDGANHGSTLQACINSCKKRKVKSIVIAIPVLSSKVFEEVNPRVENIVYLIKSDDFKGINKYYRDYKPLDDKLFNNRLEVLLSYKNEEMVAV